MKSRIENRAQIRRRLLAWYDRSARKLPWRETKDPYRIWLSEIMLQQTRAEVVAERWRRFIKKFPDISALAAASPDAVLKEWEGLGYYARARNLHDAAQMIVGDGCFPRSVGQWLALPGVGRYTAGAVCSIAFGIPAAVVDGNVRRVLARLTTLLEPGGSSVAEKKLWAMAEALVPQKRPGDFNQALMELGACVCLPRHPRCRDCPLTKFCGAYVQGHPERYPRARQKSEPPERAVAAAILHIGRRQVFVQRPLRGLLGGLWDLPGVPLASGRSPKTALRKMLAEDFGVEVVAQKCPGKVTHAFSHFTLSLLVYDCQIRSGKFRPRSGLKCRLMTRADFRRFAFPAAVRKAMALRSYKTVADDPVNMEIR